MGSRARQALIGRIRPNADRGWRYVVRRTMRGPPRRFGVPLLEGLLSSGSSRRAERIGDRRANVSTLILENDQNEVKMIQKPSKIDRKTSKNDQKSTKNGSKSSKNGSPVGSSNAALARVLPLFSRQVSCIDTRCHDMAHGKNRTFPTTRLELAMKKRKCRSRGAWAWRRRVFGWSVLDAERPPLRRLRRRRARIGPVRSLNQWHVTGYVVAKGRLLQAIADL